MLQIIKRYLKQPHLIEQGTKLMIDTMDACKIGNKISLHTLHLIVNDSIQDLNKSSFKLCLNRAREYYERDYKTRVDKNNIYFKPKQMRVN